jgi:hypothetical protein
MKSILFLTGAAAKEPASAKAVPLLSPGKEPEGSCGRKESVANPSKDVGDCGT